jgi:AraC-like DNA-binding protein
MFSKELHYNYEIASENQIDKEFLRKIMQSIEMNLSNSNFDVALFANELNIGRSAFFKKIKALTNHTPYELVTGVRLQKAADLLINSPKNISEIAFEVGYNGLSSFTRAFTKQYSMSPTKYTEVHRN